MSPTSKLGIDGRVLARYLYSQEQYVTDGTPQKTRRVINGHPVVRDTDGRAIRRWDQGAVATRKGATNMLTKFDLSLDGFQSWCAQKKYKPTVRGEI